MHARIHSANLTNIVQRPPRGHLLGCEKKKKSVLRNKKQKLCSKKKTTQDRTRKEMGRGRNNQRGPDKPASAPTADGDPVGWGGRPRGPAPPQAPPRALGPSPPAPPRPPPRGARAGRAAWRRRRAPLRRVLRSRLRRRRLRSRPTANPRPSPAPRRSLSVRCPRRARSGRR